jgi:copper chaperone CopZ
MEKDMKKTLFAALAVLFVFAISANVFAEVKYAKIKTSATCADCKTRIETATKDLSGVLDSQLDLETKVVTVKYDSDKTSTDKIRKSISYAGYQADDMAADKKAYAKLPGHCKAKTEGCCSSKDKAKTEGCCSSKDKAKTEGCCSSKDKAKTTGCSSKTEGCSSKTSSCSSKEKK